MKRSTFSVEVITLPVSDVERALQFYFDQVGFNLHVDYSPNDAFRVVQLTPRGSGCSVQIGKGLTHAHVGSSRNIFLVVTDLEAARKCLIERGVNVSEVSPPGSTPLAETMLASPTSPIQTATAGVTGTRLRQCVKQSEVSKVIKLVMSTIRD